KPVYWCPECRTALAEAEIEYDEDPCYSIFVTFDLVDDKGLFAAAGADLTKTSFVIWTTTAWTLPGNLAICLGPEFKYHLIRCGDKYLVMADGLHEAALKACKIEDYEIAATFTGGQLEGMVARHPFLDRDSLVITGGHVTLESGTGCVHTAPGHGVEDFEVCRKYDLPVVVPVDSAGRMTAEAGDFCAGMTTNDAGRVIAKALQESGHLLATERIIHQYPHCWRCRQPVLFRATEQWFCSVDAFKDRAIEEIRKVKWIPGWGEERISAMVRERSDWCISRQRLWGVPIPIFYCDSCEKPVIDRDFISAVAELFEKESSDGWYTHTAGEILPQGAQCPHCGGKNFTKETDIMDVWFDSGSSHFDVCQNRPYLRWPADLYLEGGDQHRGWFQSSLLTAVAVKGAAPYRAVLTHGWTVDGEGKKMSKSLGNGIEPEEVISEYGADILRLWVASLDYRVDARLSKEILKQLTEAYRKIRNTARFLLSNLYDFDPDIDMVEPGALAEIDRWAMTRLDMLAGQVNRAYKAFEFHDAYHRIHNFCVVEMSNFYLDVLKDRLYCERGGSATRRAAQSVVYTLLHTLTRLIAPILAFTADEIWGFMPHKVEDDTHSVMLNPMPDAGDREPDQAFMDRWEKIHAIREDVKKALELARTAKVIGAPLDAKVTLYLSGETAEFVREVRELLPAALIVSAVEISEENPPEGCYDGETVVVHVAKADGGKCARCWSYSPTVGESHPEVCERCAEILL
ncbi:MAG: isoleucine--tRNA ligase, partial [Oscillospiraceae bacterium]|nr:isoleucine--tRNA ligase [Oscillospiraceae bacterium]